MKTIRKYMDIAHDILVSPRYVKELPAGLRNYVVSRFIIPLLVPLAGLITLVIAPFSWATLAAIVLVEIVAICYSLYTCYEIVRGNYYIVSGTVKAVEPAGLFAGAIENLTQSGKNQKLIIERPDGTFAAVYIGRKIRNEYSVGLPVIVYAENVYTENGIASIRNYYTIVIAPSEPEQEAEPEAEIGESTVNIVIDEEAE